MRKILGSNEMYCDQTNDASVELFKDYFKKSKLVACGPNAAAMGFEVAGWPMTVFTPGAQASDIILMIMENPKNLSLFKARRNIDYDTYPVNEVPQTYDVLAKLIYGVEVCQYNEGLNYEIIRGCIMDDTPAMISGQFPAGGHFVLAVGFDDEKKVIIYNDPDRYQWPDQKGYNREMDMAFLAEKISKYRVEFRPY